MLCLPVVLCVFYCIAITDWTENCTLIVSLFLRWFIVFFGAMETAESRALTVPSRANELANLQCNSIGGFRCRKCNSFSCYHCTTCIRNYIHPDDAAMDAWCQAIDKCLQLPNLLNRDHILPIGHCCELKQHTITTKESNCRTSSIITVKDTSGKPNPNGCKGIANFG